MAIISNCTVSIIKDAALALKEGHLVAFPTETVYGLGADATNKKAVARIYQVKGRPTDHPLIVHISSMELLDKWATEIPEYAIKLARQFWPGPMTLVLPRSKLARNFITGNRNTIAIRVPSNPITKKLLIEFEALGGFGVVAPSANRFSKVSPTSVWAVEEELGGYLNQYDKILDGGNSQIGIESTIIDCSEDLPLILRPGSLSIENIQGIMSIEFRCIESISPNVKFSGMHAKHYAPNTRVELNGIPKPGQGFIALSEILTPPGAIRLASPKNLKDYAKELYGALRLADKMKIGLVQVVTPIEEGIGIAICDRLRKASYKD